MRVGIIGVGTVGLCCARALRAVEAEVIVIERDRCGSGVSLGNAGWITPGFSAPIAAPGTVRRAARWMFDPGSPFLVRPRASLGLVSWSWRFWRSCDPERYRAGTAAILRLNATTFDLFDDLQVSGLEFEMRSTGVLFVALEEHALAEYLEMFAVLTRLGYEGQVESLSAAEARVRDPSLSELVVGGLHAHNERYVRPECLNAALERRLREAGVEIREHTTVHGMTPANRTWQIATDRGEVVVDRVVVAAGAWSGELLRRIGFRVPIEAAKGYSITAVGSGSRPNHPLYLTEAKVAFTPFESGSRIAGTLELAGLDLRVDRRRLGTIVNATSRYLHDWRPDGVQLEWCGLRSFAPDGLPIIGELPGRRGLYVATAHGMLGITLAPATAAMLTRQVLTDEQPPELRPFSPSRFTHRRTRRPTRTGSSRRRRDARHL